MQALPGFRDFLPSDCSRRNYIFGQWRKTARRYGFMEWDGPVLEATDLYRKKSGDEIVDQLFHFVDKGEREVALRPELTPTLARVVAAHEREFKKPLKWFSIGQFFRYEKQQRGRLREHFQLNCDIIGEASLAADVELLALAIDLLRSFGLDQADFVVRLSDRQFWTDFLGSQGVTENKWQQTLEIIDKSERESPEKTKERLGDLAAPVFKLLAEGGKSDRLNEVLDGLRARGLSDYVNVDLRIVRGLAYYTGIVFEIFDRAGKLRAIAGGGRYDNLVGQLSEGATKLPALGFAMGDVVLGELIGETARAREQMDATIRDDHPVEIYIVIAKEDRRQNALQHMQALREHGYRVDYPLTPTKIPKQFQTAEQLGARIAVLFGDEWPNVAVKNLVSGEQQLVISERLAGHLETILR
ncbi:MAG TPA: histidine--tRNA ligase [Chthoniobacterales bacterium]